MTRKIRIGDDNVALDGLIQEGKRIGSWKNFVAFPNSKFFSDLISKALSNRVRSRNGTTVRTEFGGESELIIAEAWRQQQEDQSRLAKEVSDKYGVYKPRKLTTQEEEQRKYSTLNTEVSDEIIFDDIATHFVIVDDSLTLDDPNYHGEVYDDLSVDDPNYHGEVSDIVNIDDPNRQCAVSDEISIDDIVPYGECTVNEEILLGDELGREFTVDDYLAIEDRVGFGTSSIEYLNIDDNVYLGVFIDDKLLFSDLVGMGIQVYERMGIADKIHIGSMRQVDENITISDSVRYGHQVDSNIAINDDLGRKGYIYRDANETLRIRDSVRSYTSRPVFDRIRFSDNVRRIRYSKKYGSVENRIIMSDLVMTGKKADVYDNIILNDLATGQKSTPISIINITATTPSAAKLGSVNGVFRISRSNTAGTLRVYYYESGTATNWVDYEGLSGFVDFPDGVANQYIIINPYETSVSNAWSLTSTMNITPNVNYTIGPNGSATVNIDCNLIANGGFTTNLNNWTTLSPLVSRVSPGGNPGGFLGLENGGSVSTTVPTVYNGHYEMYVDHKLFEGSYFIYIETDYPQDSPWLWTHPADWETVLVTFRTYLEPYQNYFLGKSGTTTIIIKDYPFADNVMGVDNVRVRRIQ